MTSQKWSGFALGLFAIFGILRYRTDTIPIKEMTYLFVVIGLSVINALANKKISYAELVFTNSIIVFMVYGYEYLWLTESTISKKIVYMIDMAGMESSSMVGIL